MMSFLIQGHNLKENIIIINCLQDNKTIVLKVGLLFFRIRVDKIITFLGFFPFFFFPEEYVQREKTFVRSYTS